jgi:PAS domain-containing protein
MILPLDNQIAVCCLTMTNDGVFHREVFGGLIEDTTSAPARHLFKKWSEIRRHRTPTYGDFLPDSNPRIAENAMVLIAAESGDFVYLSMGSTTMRLVGRDLTGRSVASLEGAVIRYAETIYRRVRDSFIPAHCLFSANYRDIVDLWERIVLPVQTVQGSGPVCLLLYSEPVNFRANMLERALESVDNAIVCTRPMVDRSGRITDAWITFANRAARNLFDLNDSRPDQMTRKVPFLFGDDSIWAQLTEPRPVEPRTILHRNPKTQADYMISSRLADDHLIFSITSLTAEPGDLVWL